MQLDAETLSKDVLAYEEPIDLADALKSLSIGEFFARRNVNGSGVHAFVGSLQDMQLMQRQVDILTNAKPHEYIAQPWPALLNAAGLTEQPLELTESLRRQIFLGIIDLMGKSMLLTPKAIGTTGVIAFSIDRTNTEMDDSMRLNALTTVLMQIVQEQVQAVRSRGLIDAKLHRDKLRNIDPVDLSETKISSDIAAGYRQTTIAVGRALGLQVK